MHAHDHLYSNRSAEYTCTAWRDCIIVYSLINAVYTVYIHLWQYFREADIWRQGTQEYWTCQCRLYGNWIYEYRVSKNIGSLSWSAWTRIYMLYVLGYPWVFMTSGYVLGHWTHDIKIFINIRVMTSRWVGQLGPNI